ncbi:HD domain-containing protein [Aquimarina algicola]|uniref:Bifunctional (P)ppGpp synthetase/guanosine-3',5'-bis(Diphosphate) 3'-pyrophosphohydrolase n=1 Tax=Aquimarina algicola TaxID=2589995 RepID=A0A504J7K7_9FLAO|nr:HD domain-containing protein [Aquimarina algicola]TPN86807.1 bifunctional (p)ppGpp synthetase/guanosine-3',5'-bis(diphosphate) 3'-pyrophosphohydrolase [Aquimarina algicola]
MDEKWSIDKLQDAWKIASKLHDGQKYGGPNKGEKVEYINHIGSVVFEVLNAAQLSDDFDTNLAMHCAVLHDTIEDTDFDYAKAKQLFGEKIADGVSALTKNESLPGKQEMMIDSLERVKKQPKEVWAVKMADRICNLYEPPFYWSNDKKEKYISEAKMIYEYLKDGNDYLAKRLKNKIEKYHAFLEK